MGKLIWPNFYVVGAVKCGTTTLYAQLKQHPQVFLPEMKEPHFFRSFSLPPWLEYEHCSGNLEAYQRLYRGAEKYPAIGDTSPSYLWDEQAPKKIFAICPHARIIMILRDPVARAYSEYLMSLMNGAETLPLPDAFYKDVEQVERTDREIWDARMYIKKGLYHDQVLRYLDTFGSEQVLVLLTDDLHKKPLEVYSRIGKHIGIDPGPFEKLDFSEAQNEFRMPRNLALFHLFNSATAQRLKRVLLPDSVRKRLRDSRVLHYSPLLYKTKKPPMDPESRRFLQEIFDPDVRNLEKLLGRELPELRKSWDKR